MAQREKLKGAHLHYLQTQKLPPVDSLVDLNCGCGFHGPHVTQDFELCKNVAEYVFMCPACGENTKFRLKLNWRENFRIWLSKTLRALRRKKRVLGMVALVGMVVALAATQDVPRKGLQVLLSKGPTAAIEYLKDPATDQEKLARAWAFYSKGEEDRALLLANRLVTREDLNLKTMGDTYYLLGLLNRETEAGMKFLEKARETYERTGSLNSLFQVMVGMADLEFSAGNLIGGELLLQEATGLNAPSPNWGFYFEALAWLHIWMGDFDQAEKVILRGMNSLGESDINGLARMKSTMGFSKMLIGDLREGLVETAEAERLVVEAGKTRLWYFNQVNYFLYHRINCSGMDSVYSGIIETRLKSHPDRLLRKVFDFVSSIECGPSPDLVGDGENPPPPPDKK